VVPLLVLFELSIWLSVFMERRWERGAEAEAEPL
jgi:Sec-independent protein secretion pathway component TatC